MNIALGTIYREDFEDFEQAIQYYTKAKESGDQTLIEQSLFGRALSYGGLKRFQEAIADWSEVIRLDPGSDNYVLRANTYRDWGKNTEAEQDYTSAIETSPNVGKYYLSRAEFYAQTDQVEKAVADYQQFLEYRDQEEIQELIDKAEQYIEQYNATPTQPISTTEALGIGSQFTNSIDGAVYVYVPEGTFIMGSNDGYEDEKPEHEVYLDAFWIGQTEVTNEQYEKCFEASECTKPNNPDWGTNEFWAKYDKHPVTYVTWEQANDYAQWAGGRLPTEAEWEKAARGPDGNIYPWGNELPNDDLLNFNNSVGSTTAVGSYPNGKSFYGAYDMAGNVYEWVADWYEFDYRNSSSLRNPTGPETGEHHVLKGGQYSFDASFMRCSERNWYRVDSDNVVGFRIVRDTFPDSQ